MGQVVTSFKEFPLRQRPVCFYPYENFDTTGEERKDLLNYATNGEFEQVQAKFVLKLMEIKALNRSTRHPIDAQRFPGWDAMTLENLQSIFLLVTNENVGQMNFKQFCIALDSLCDKTPRTFQRDKFQTFDKFNTGWINFDQFTMLIYTFNRKKNQNTGLKGLAKTCKEISNDLEFVEGLSLGCQLQNGLF